MKLRFGFLLKRQMSQLQNATMLASPEGHGGLRPAASRSVSSFVFTE